VDLAGVGPCPPRVRARQQSLRRRPAPRHRDRREGRRDRDRPAGRHDHVRGRRADVRAVGDDRDRRRLLRNARPPELDRGQALELDRGRCARRDNRRSGRGRARGTVRSSRSPNHGRPERVPRSVGVPACAGGRAEPAAGTRPGGEERRLRRPTGGRRRPCAARVGRTDEAGAGARALVRFDHVFRSRAGRARRGTGCAGRAGSPGRTGGGCDPSHGRSAGRRLERGRRGRVDARTCCRGRDPRAPHGDDADRRERRQTEDGA
jgi:hypothetical protein